MQASGLNNQLWVTNLKQAAMTKMRPGLRLGMAEATAGVVFFIPSSISSWNTVVLDE